VADLLPRILFDTNFLMIPLRFGVDIFEEAGRALNQPPEFYVTRSVLKEIAQLKQDARPSFFKELSFAEKIAERCSVLEVEVEDGETVDDSILRTAEKKRFIVGTTDVELRKKLRAVGVKVLVLRQRRYLELLG
jgi:rRNA-processing protein FCF1